MTTTVDMMVLGSGVAGLSAAVRAAEVGMSVVVLTKAEIGNSTTRYAQGGIGAAMEEPDSPELHLSDTLAAGAGLCDPEATRVLAVEGPERIRELIALGASFDPRASEIPGFARGREGGHSVRRVLHAGGDATGVEVERALVAATRARAAEVREGWFASSLIVEAGRCVGVRASDPAGMPHEVRATNTLLATGGIGALYAVTTNPPLATGDGLGMAWRAGAALCDVEFVQFHPTALHHPARPRPLLSEALRGEGAHLRDESGGLLMEGVHPLGDLAPRDVVASAIARRMAEADVEHLWLDATGVVDVDERFPTIVASCRSLGLDPGVDWLPVAPAAHYLCGGVAVDLDGATTVPGLWACGEVAASGVHGANRLASNSLLDGLVFSGRCVEALARGKSSAERSGVLCGGSGRGPVPDGNTSLDSITPAEPETADAVPSLEALQVTMTREAGVVRTAESLERAAAVLDSFRGGATFPDGREEAELDNLVITGHALVASALRREESRGTHQRADHPGTREGWLGRLFVTRGHEPDYVPLPSVRTPPTRSHVP
ncbi:MAG: L-aspartate oxidase [Acidimicrobiia bacterium]|nr:L-aspartate oxidase [Acidimicrobiia bacterium]